MSDPLSRIDKRIEETFGQSAVGPNAQAEKDARLIRRATKEKLKKDRDDNRDENKKEIESLGAGSQLTQLNQKLDQLLGDQ